MRRVRMQHPRRLSTAGDECVCLRPGRSLNGAISHRIRARAIRGGALAAAVAALVAPVVAQAAPTARADRGASAWQASDQSSLNWAGYIDVPQSGKVTAAQGAFTVPALSSPAPPGLTSTWVGIGGSTTSDLIQAGVEEDTVGTPATGAPYRAWYELLPAAQTPLTKCKGDSSCAVRAGDHITVDIRTVGSKRWRITVTNARHWVWRQDVSYLSSGSSAEWIAEATSIIAVPVAYANLAPVLFDRGTYTATGTGTRTIGRGRPTLTAIRPANSAVAEALPSRLDRDGDGFNVCAYATECPTPRS
jgi:hypothetical protein